MAQDDVALLIVRAWLEPGSSVPLRVQLRWTTDVRQGFQHSLTATAVDDVLEATAAWLAAVITAERGDPDTRR